MTVDNAGDALATPMVQLFASSTAATSGDPSATGVPCGVDNVTSTATCTGIVYNLTASEITAGQATLWAKVGGTWDNTTAGDPAVAIAKAATVSKTVKLGVLTAGAPSTTAAQPLTVGQTVPITVNFTNAGPSEVTDLGLKINGGAALPCGTNVTASDGTTDGTGTCTVQYTVVTADITGAVSGTRQLAVVPDSTVIPTIAAQDLAVTVAPPLQTAFAASDCSLSVSSGAVT